MRRERVRRSDGTASILSVLCLLEQVRRIGHTAELSRAAHSPEWRGNAGSASRYCSGMKVGTAFDLHVHGLLV